MVMVHAYTTLVYEKKKKSAKVFHRGYVMLETILPRQRIQSCFSTNYPLTICVDPRIPNTLLCQRNQTHHRVSRSHV